MTPIQFRHNVPLFGWLALRGRCAACRLPISPRYPLVELIVGVLFFSLFWAEVASGGANLPYHTPSRRVGVMWNLFTPQWDLISTYFFHAFLLGVLATIALIKYDGLPIPRRLLWFTAAVGLACQMVWPHLTIVPAAPWMEPGEVPIPSLASPLWGLAVGGVVGVLVDGVFRMTSASMVHEESCGGVAISGLVGLFLGWQTTISVLVIAAGLQLLLRLASRLAGKRSDVPLARLWAANCLFATWGVICCWQQLSLVWLPNPQSSQLMLLGGLGFGLAMICVGRSLIRCEADNVADPRSTAGNAADARD